MQTFIDNTAPSLQGKLPKLAQDLPHGLIAPPALVLEHIEKERGKHQAEPFARSYEDLLNRWTLPYYFDYLGYEVLYRQTPAGPEVLTVGFDEIFALTDNMNPDKMVGLNTWMP